MTAGLAHQLLAGDWVVIDRCECVSEVFNPLRLTILEVELPVFDQDGLRGVFIDIGMRFVIHDYISVLWFILLDFVHSPWMPGAFAGIHGFIIYFRFFV